MNGFLQVMNNVTGSIRFIVGMFVLCIFGLGLILTVGAGVIVPQAAEKVGERAERAHDKAIEAARQEARNRSYAAQGWGYEDSAPAPTGGGSDPEGEYVGGWGD